MVRTHQTVDSALLVPQRATYELQGKRFVYVVGPDSLVKNLEVTVAPTPDGHSFVVQQGLAAGDRVVIEGAGELKDGTKIIPRPAGPDGPSPKTVAAR